MNKKELIEDIINKLGDKYRHNCNSYLRMSFQRISIHNLEILREDLDNLHNLTGVEECKECQHNPNLYKKQ